MTKISNFALKIKGVVGRVAHAKSSDPAAPLRSLFRKDSLLQERTSKKHGSCLSA